VYFSDNNDLFDDEPSSGRQYYRDPSDDISPADRYGGGGRRYRDPADDVSPPDRYSGGGSRYTDNDSSPPTRRSVRRDSDQRWKETGASTNRVTLSLACQ